MSLYADYVKETRDAKCIETDKGFIEYSAPKDGVIYICSIYVIPEERRKGYGAVLENKLVEEEKPVTLLCDVQLQYANPELSLKAILARDYKILEANEKTIRLYKQLETNDG